MKIVLTLDEEEKRKEKKGSRLARRTENVQHKNKRGHTISHKLFPLQKTDSGPDRDRTEPSPRTRTSVVT